MLPGNRRRFLQLREAALNMGMRESDADFYAKEVLKKELEAGDWHVVPNCTEAAHNAP